MKSIGSLSRWIACGVVAVSNLLATSTEAAVGRAVVRAVRGTAEFMVDRITSQVSSIVSRAAVGTTSERLKTLEIALLGGLNSDGANELARANALNGHVEENLIPEILYTHRVNRKMAQLFAEAELAIQKVTADGFKQYVGQNPKMTPQEFLTLLAFSTTKTSLVPNSDPRTQSLESFPLVRLP